MIVVFKIGSSSLYDNAPLGGVFSDIARAVTDHIERGDKVAIVSSGAIAFGRGRMGIDPSTKQTIAQRQAMASIGQTTLIEHWQQALGWYGIKAGQVLVTNEVLESTESKGIGHLRDTFQSLFAIDAVPIVNENDAVAVVEIVLGDNDRLAAHIANICDADELFLLGKAQAIYETRGKPETRITATNLGDVDHLRKISGGTNDPQATGGMVTKVDAAEIFLQHNNTDNHKTMYIGPAVGDDVISKARRQSHGTKIMLR